MVRENNEDFYLWRRADAPQDSELGAIYVVADGVGGGLAGEDASRVAAETAVGEYLASPATSPGDALSRAVAAANSAVHEAAYEDGRATTLVAAAIAADVLYVANVGDSRLYVVRGDEITQVTRDHSWVHEQVLAGRLRADQAERHPRRNVITRWLGQQTVEADLNTVRLQPGDRILLCTDGLVRHVGDETAKSVIQRLPEQEAADELVRLANEGGGTDNVTAVVISIEGATQGAIEGDPDGLAKPSGARDEQTTGQPRAEAIRRRLPRPLAWLIRAACRPRRL